MIPTHEKDVACKGKQISVIWARDVIIDKFCLQLFQSVLDGLIMMNPGWQPIVQYKDRKSVV